MSNNPPRKQKQTRRGRGVYSNGGCTRQARSRQAISRYLYDDGPQQHQQQRDNSSAITSGDSSCNTLGDSSSYLEGFDDVYIDIAVEPLEDEEGSEVTNRMNNLSSAKYGQRRFPKHHSGYRRPDHYAARYSDDATPMSSLTEHAVMSMHCNDSMNFNDAYVLEDEDSEAPTNVTANSSFVDEERQTIIVRNAVSSTDEPEDDTGVVSIGIVTRPKPSVLASCVPSVGTLSRWFFLLGCVLTLWMAIDGLVWAKEQAKERDESALSQRYNSRRLRRRYQSDPLKNVTHQQQWNSNTIWSYLQQDEQEAWNQLGFDEEKWDNQDSVSSDNIDWDKLTEDQEVAAVDLGFTKPLWDHFNNNQSVAAREEDSDDTSLPEPERLNQIVTTSSSTEAPESQSGDEPTAFEPTMVPTASSSTFNANGKDAEIFAVTGSSIPVTKYMVLTFAAALCFTMVGVIEWIQHDYLFQLLLAVSGAWGLLSAMFIHRNPGVSLAFHVLAVHFFLGAAIGVLRLRCRQPRVPEQSRSGRVTSRSFEEFLLLADLCLAVGAAMTCASSYLTLRYGIDQAPLVVDVQRLNVFGAFLWVACAVVYLGLAHKTNR